MNFKKIFGKIVTYDQVKSDIYRCMLFGIQIRTPRTPKFWHTHLITYGDFVVILVVEPCKCDQLSDLWQQLVLTSELESDLPDTVDWSRKWLVDFNAAKIQLVLIDQSNNTGAIDVKIDGFILEEKSSFKIVG